MAFLWVAVKKKATHVICRMVIRKTRNKHEESENRTFSETAENIGKTPNTQDSIMDCMVEATKDIVTRDTPLRPRADCRDMRSQSIRKNSGLLKDVNKPHHTP